MHPGFLISSDFDSVNFIQERKMWTYLYNIDVDITINCFCLQLLMRLGNSLMMPRQN